LVRMLFVMFFIPFLITPMQPIFHEGSKVCLAMRGCAK
jgi:hypothetical protein